LSSIAESKGEVMIFRIWQVLQDLDVVNYLEGATLPHLGEPLLEAYEGLTVTKYVKPFEKCIWECRICFSEYLGTEMVLNNNCGHYFCRQCSTEFLSMHINESSAHAIRCPESGCGEDFPVFLIRLLVSEDHYKRYDRLMLVHALDKMSDLAYCPVKQCGHAVVVPKNTRYALCPGCHYQFCLRCFGVYHGFGTCPKYLNEDEKEKASRKYIESVGRHCPSCNVVIEKNGGCSHMYCVRCETHFDWDDASAAGRPSVSHLQEVHLQETQVQGGCQAISEPSPSNLRVSIGHANRVIHHKSTQTAVVPSLQTEVSKPCPRCHLRRRKYATVGDTVYCLNCQKGFCFHCGSDLNGAHFVGGLCHNRPKKGTF